MWCDVIEIDIIVASILLYRLYCCLFRWDYSDLCWCSVCSLFWKCTCLSSWESSNHLCKYRTYCSYYLFSPRGDNFFRGASFFCRCMQSYRALKHVIIARLLRSDDNIFGVSLFYLTNRSVWWSSSLLSYVQYNTVYIIPYHNLLFFRGHLKSVSSRGIEWLRTYQSYNSTNASIDPVVLVVLLYLVLVATTSSQKIHNNIYYRDTKW